jgi:hypothetical protein
MIEKYHKVFGIVFLFVILALNITAFFFLPDTLVMQIACNGEAGTTLPKIYGIGGIIFLGIIGSYYLLFGKTKEDYSRWFLGLLVILFADLFMIIFNL